MITKIFLPSLCVTLLLHIGFCPAASACLLSDSVTKSIPDTIVKQLPDSVIKSIPDTVAARNLPDTIINSPGSDELVADTLPELTVSSKTVTHMGNTDMYLVTKEMREGAHVAGDLLGNIPGMYYNPVTRDLSYLGSGKIMILVDSLERDAEYIKRLSPDRFVKISVTNYPGGKYLGYDAVANFTTKKTYTGYDGTVLAETKLLPGNNNGGGNNVSVMRDIIEATYTRERWNFAFSGTFNYQRLATGSESVTEYPLNEYSQVTQMPPLRNPNKFFRRNETPLNLWTDFMINSSNTLSIGLTLVTSSVTDNDNSIVMTGHPGKALNPEEQHSKDSYRNAISPSVILQYLGTVGKWQMSASAQLTRSSYNRMRSVRRDAFAIEDNRRIVSNFLWTGADASRYIAGSKMLLRFSDYLTALNYKEREFTSRAILTSSKDIRNTFSAGLQYFPSNSFVVGLDAGFDLYSGKWSDKRDTNVSPRIVFNMMWAIPNFTFRINYANTTSYPTLAQQQDYGAFSDSLIYRSGNPDLVPIRTNSVGMTVNLFRYITLGASFTDMRNSVFDIAGTAYGTRPDMLTGDYVTFRYENARYRAWRGNVTFSKSFRNILTVSATVSADRKEARFGNFRSAKTLPSYNWFVMYDNARAALQIYLSGSMNPDLNVTPQEISWSRYDSYSISAVKFFFNYKLQIMAMAPIPIHFFKKPHTTEFNSPGYIFHMHDDSLERLKRAFTLTLVWRFSGGEQTRKTNHLTGSVELY